MRTTIMTTLDGIRALAPQWGKLTPPSPFASWDYAYDWLRCAPQAQPYVIALHDQGQLVGVAPWCVLRDYAGSRILTGIGGDSAWYHDPVLSDRTEAQAAFRALGKALRQRKWDAIDLTLQAERSLSLVTELKQLGMTVAQRPNARQSHLIALEDNWEATWLQFPSGYRKNIRRLNRHLEARAHRYLRVQPEDALDCLEELIQLNRTRWQTGHNWDLAYAVLRANTPTLLAQGNLRFFGLEIEGRMAAAIYLVRKGDRCFALMGNYHPDFTDYSPSNLLLHWTLTQLQQEGIRGVDLGPGEYAYKNRLQSGLVETVRTYVGASLMGMALVGWRGVIKPRLSHAI